MVAYAHVLVIYFWSCRSAWKVLQPEEKGSIGMLRWYHHDRNDWNKQHHPWPLAPRSAGRIRTDRPKAQRSPCLSEAWWWRGRHVIDVWLCSKLYNTTTIPAVFSFETPSNNWADPKSPQPARLLRQHGSQCMKQQRCWRANLDTKLPDYWISKQNRSHVLLCIQRLRTHKFKWSTMPTPLMNWL